MVSVVWLVRSPDSFSWHRDAMDLSYYMEISLYLVGVYIFFCKVHRSFLLYGCLKGNEQEYALYSWFYDCR